MLPQTILLVSLFVLCHGMMDRIVCYTSNRGQTQKGFGKFTPETYAIEAKPCTHLVFGELVIKKSWIVRRLRSDLRTIKAIRKARREQNSTLKFLLSVGDYETGTAKWTKVAKTNSTRIHFVMRALYFLRNLRVDGLYLNWEWPAHRDSPSRDRENYYQLIKLFQLRFRQYAALFREPKKILTAGFNCDSDKVSHAYDVKRIHPHLDFLSLVAMNFQGSWTGHTGHHTALFQHLGSYSGDDLSTRNVDWCVQYYLGEGVPPDKMNLGLAAFGRTFTTKAKGKEIVPSLGPGTPKYFTQTKGIIAFFEACRRYMDPHQEFVPMSRDQEGQKKVYVRAIMVGDQYIGMEDPESISMKVCYANKYKLGGITFYNLEFDDFTGWFCKRGRFPLLRSAFETVVISPQFICPEELLADDQKSIKDVTDLSSTIQVNTGFTTVIVLCAILYNAQLFEVN